MSNFKLMGILNGTPDSFSDGGDHYSLNDFKNHLQKWLNIKECLIIDIGVESTAPFNEPITFEEEKQRLEEVVFPALKQVNIGHKILSFDTYRLETFDFIYQYCKAHHPSQKIIWNDVSGLLDETVFKNLKEKYQDVDYVLGHSLIPLRELTSDHMKYVSDKSSVFDMVVDHFKKAQIFMDSYDLQNRIIFDPCFGFSKSFDQNIDLLDRIHELVQTFESEQRWLMGISRKSFLKKMATSKSNIYQQCDSMQSVVIAREMTKSASYNLLWRVHSPDSFLIPFNFMRGIFLPSE